MIPFTSHTIPGEFEEAYVRLRRKEGRMYSDEEVAKLPEIASSHPHHAEWKMRKQSCERLIDYLQHIATTSAGFGKWNILEAGCGNGWLSHQMSTIPGTHVTGIDINQLELEQAARVFKAIPNLRFQQGSIGGGWAAGQGYDCIVFAASIQYFKSLSGSVREAMTLLAPGGEIHILDSPFYELAELEAARQRSASYYQSIGFPEMAESYFHHSLAELIDFKYSILYNPHRWPKIGLSRKNIFYWLRIRQ